MTRPTFPTAAHAARDQRAKERLDTLVATVRASPGISAQQLAKVLGCVTDVARARALRAIGLGLICCPVREGRRVHRYTVVA